MKSINNVCHYKWPECSYQILDESNKILRSQKTAEVSSPNPSNEVRKPLQAKLSAKYTDEQTTEVSGARDKPQHSVRNFRCHPETPLKDNNLKPVIDVIHHNQRHRNECNNRFPSQKTTDICSDNLSNETRNPLQSRTPPKYMYEQSFTNVSDAKNHKDRKGNKQQFSLRNFTCKLETTPQDKSFKPMNDVVYHNQWTECSYQIFDEFNNPLCLKKTSLADVSSSSRYVECRDIKIKKNHLHFKMKSIQTGNISTLIKIDNYALTKDFCVTFNPCSSSLSDMTIEKINPVEEEFVYRLFIFDVFGEPVPSNSTATLELDASFQSDENKVVSKVKRIKQEQVCYDITVRGNRPWSRDLIVLLNGKQVNHAREFEFTNEECNAINDLDDDDYEWIQKVFPERDCGIFIPLTTGDDDGMFVAYNEDDYELKSQNAKDHQLICKNVRKHDILGEDFAHIDNIRRVLEIKDLVEIERIDSHSIIHLRNIRPHLRPICKEVVQHLLRGLYYRRKASEAAKIRMEWKNRLISIDEILLSSKEEASFMFCKYFKDFFGDLLNQYNREACDELFKFFNFHRDESEVDLHGLLVADEKKLESLRLNLSIGSLRQDQIKELLETCEIKSKQGCERQTFRKKFRQGKVPEDLVRKYLRDGRIINEDYSDKSEHECSHEDCNLCFKDDDHDFGDDTDEKDNKYYDSDLEPLRSYDRKDNVDAIIRRCRKERDEAIRKLKETLEKFDEEVIFNETPWLEIIVGAGQHSKNNEQKIRPKVEKLLKERNLKFVPANKGSLVVTFKPYDGPEPCFGEYYCEKCDCCWKSSKSYIAKYQKCSACTSICRPFKQQEKEKVANYCRNGVRSMKRKPKPHQSSLCQKCHELRRPCNDVYHTRK